MKQTSSTPLVTVESRTQGTIHVVAVAGELDSSSVADVSQAIDRALGSLPDTLVLDLAELDFCDSSGIHLVRESNGRAESQGIPFRVIAPAGAARRVFEICRVADYVSGVVQTSARAYQS